MKLSSPVARQLQCKTNNKNHWSEETVRVYAFCVSSILNILKLTILSHKFDGRERRYEKQLNLQTRFEAEPLPGHNLMYLRGSEPIRQFYRPWVNLGATRGFKSQGSWMRIHRPKITWPFLKLSYFHGLLYYEKTPER